MQAPYKTQLEPMLQQFVLPCFDAPAGHVRAKACWVAQQYADVKFAEGKGRGATFMQLFQKTLERLNDPDLPVRLQPCLHTCVCSGTPAGNEAGSWRSAVSLAACNTRCNAL